MTVIAPTLQGFFTERLAQRGVSTNTVAAYRDSLRLLVCFVHDTTGKAPSEFDFEDLDANTVSAFLLHLETVRGSSVATRNARLAAVHSLFRYAALRHPEHAATIGSVLAIPTKRGERTLVCFLTQAETEALIEAPDRSSGFQQTPDGQAGPLCPSDVDNKGFSRLTVACPTSDTRVSDVVVTLGPERASWVLGRA